MWKYWLASFIVQHNKTGNGTPPLSISQQTNQVFFLQALSNWRNNSQKTAPQATLNRHPVISPISSLRLSGEGGSRYLVSMEGADNTSAPRQQSSVLAFCWSLSDCFNCLTYHNNQKTPQKRPLTCSVSGSKSMSQKHGLVGRPGMVGIQEGKQQETSIHKVDVLMNTVRGDKVRWFLS